MKDLTTTDGVLAYWGHSPCDCGCRATAPRIARGQRLLAAWEDGYDTGLDNVGSPMTRHEVARRNEQRLEHLRAALDAEDGGER